MKTNAAPSFLLVLWLVLFVARVSAQAPEPLLTLRAATDDRVTMRLGYESFHDMELDEVDRFDGWTAAAELSVPFMERFRLRLAWPFRTEGDAVIKPGQGYPPDTEIDIEGSGGVYDFATLTFEHQLVFAADRGFDLGYYLGLGTKADRLDTTKYNPDDGRNDPFNHTGNLMHLGVRFDRMHGFGEVLGNAGVRYYWNSDDIYPGGNKDSFLALDLRGAVVFHPWGSVYPAVELAYLGDLSDFNQFTLVPELLWPVAEPLHLKLGVVVGLGGTGSQYGGRAELAVRF